MQTLSASDDDERVRNVGDEITRKAEFALEGNCRFSGKSPRMDMQHYMNSKLNICNLCEPSFSSFVSGERGESITRNVNL